MTESPVCMAPGATACAACGTNPSVAVPDEGWTPLCSDCTARVGTPVAIGERAVCRVGSIEGRVTRFDERSWAGSILAELAHADGWRGWYPLAELAPAT